MNLLSRGGTKLHPKKCGEIKMEIQTLEKIELPKRELTKEEVDLIYNNGESIFKDKTLPEEVREDKDDI